MDMHESEVGALEEFLPALGTLTFTFAHFESVLTAALKVVLTKRLGTDDDRLRQGFRMAHALLGSNRYSAGKEKWKNLLQAMDARKDQTGYYEKVFSHIGEIAFLRDRLCHHYTYQATKQYRGLWINTDIVSVRKAGAEKPILFPTGCVLAAAADLAAARDCFDGAFEHHVFDRERRIPYGLEAPPWRFSASMIVHGETRIGDILEGGKEPPPSWKQFVIAQSSGVAGVES